MRDFWRGEAPAAALAKRLAGSADLFDCDGRKPWTSVNFITAHDGFTLNDLVSYNDRHNEANGEDNRDGNGNNASWNGGAEGPTDDAGITAFRERQMRNLISTLFLSQGTPMLLAGDESGRTQRGNNNAYCQDNEISWLDWNHDARAQELVQFTRRLIGLRRQYAILRRDRFLSGDHNEALGLTEITWINANGAQMSAEHWQDANTRCFGMLLDGPRPADAHVQARAGRDAARLAERPS